VLFAGGETAIKVPPEGQISEPLAASKTPTAYFDVLSGTAPDQLMRFVAQVDQVLFAAGVVIVGYVLKYW
jgi:hypothetical protein